MALQFLIPVDGSATALKAIDWLIARRDDWKTPPAVHLLNVQHALPRDISRFINADEVRDFHREEGLKALAAAHQQLEAAGLAVQQHVGIGDCAETIVDFARQLHCDQIVLGTRGHSGIGGTLLGSVAAKVTHLTPVPLLLIR